MDSRIVKIFISSTFREMIDERDAIQQIVFVKIRFWARQLGVSVIPIDLRWGITEDDIEAGKLASQCEEAIEVSAPFFIGVLGNTYGTDTKSVLGHVENQYYGKSVTDYEITKGVLETNNEKAIIYNITYSDKKEGFYKKIKLRRLKKQILRQGNLVDINIKERLISTMIVDIEALLKQTFFQVHGDDNLSKYNFCIESNLYSQYYNTFFSESYFAKYFLFDDLRRGLYFICGDEYESIHFFLYNFAHLLKVKGKSIIYHDCGVSLYGSSSEGVIKHILEYIYRDIDSYFYSCGNIYEDFLTVIDQIDVRDKEYVIFIDSLSKIEKREADKLVKFLLDLNKKGICVFCSDYSNGLYFSKDKRINILPLTREEAYSYIYNYLHEYKKDNNLYLTKEIIEHILEIKNYDISFIQLILNEVLLRGCPSSEIIDEIDRLTKEEDSLGIIDRILQRILDCSEHDLEFKKTVEVVCVALSLTCDYMTKADLESIVYTLNINNIYVIDALEMLNELITVNEDKYCFRFEMIRTAIHQKYKHIIDEVDEKGVYSYFSRTTVSLHSIREIVGYLKRNKNEKEIIDYLLSEKVFEMLYIEDAPALYRELSCNNDYVAARITEILSCKEQRISFLRVKLYVEYLINCCEYRLSKKVIQHLIKEDSRHKNLWSIKLGYLERENGNYNNAIDIFLGQLDTELMCDDRVIIFDYLSYCYGKINKTEESIKYAEMAIRLRKSNLSKYEFDLPVSLNSLAYNYYRNNSSEKAVSLYKEACDIRIKFLGTEHPRVSNNMNNIGKVYLRNGKYKEALDVFLKSYNSLRRIMGDSHNYTLICEINCIICELILKLSTPLILLRKLLIVKSSLETRIKYNDYLAYADFAIGCAYLVNKDMLEGIKYLNNAREYYLKTFSKDCFEGRIIDEILKRKNLFEMEVLF